jgi:uncharacterized protein HemX
MGDDSQVIAARLLLLAVAIAACAWFVLGVRAEHDQSTVSALINHHRSLTAAQARAAEAQLADARTLNPDETLNILRAQVELRAGHDAKAAAIAKGIVRREPQNAGAWLALELMTLYSDPATYRQAQAHVRELLPPVPSAP